MHRARFVLLAVLAALVAMMATAAAASADTVVIDARDGDAQGERWEPANVTIATGDTVRWEFDSMQLAHDVQAQSSNWTLDSEIKTPGDPPEEWTFAQPGLYTFLCTLHPAMTGSVTVEGDEPADELSSVLVFSKTAGFRHDSIDEGIAAIEQLGAANGFDVDTTEDGAAFTDANLAQYDVVVFLSTTGDVLTDTQQAAFERYIQSGHGFAGIHAATDTEYSWAWYGEMLGGYFRNHPPGTPTATVEIEDGDEPSTAGLPASWTRVDEWYNFRSPVPGANDTDYSPRSSGVKVLATVDEATYAEEDGNATDDDHPIAWCSDFDGGRAWYTAMGHTAASFADDAFLDHLIGGLRTAAGVPADCGAPRFPTPSASDFEKVTIDDDTQNPMELDVAPDGRVFYIERDGRVMVYQPSSGQTSLVGTIPVTQSQENGLLGIQLANDFATTGHVYLAYSALPDASNENRLSRFTVQDNVFVTGSEQIIYTWQHQRAQCCHTAGSIAMAPDGSIYIATGDNTNPFDSSGFTPIDERAGRSAWDAQRTSANTNDPNGKILHIVPKPDASGTPGVGTTYEIPSDNLFPESADTEDKTLPEIYAMGFRNPFRITVDPKTGWVLMGDYGPDAGSTNPNRGPQGSVEYNVVKEAGNYGWPYCIRQNVPYNDYDFATSTSGPKFDCAAPVNDSPNNTGLTNLPPAKPATMWMGYGETDARFPLLGTGGAPTGGPRYDFDADLDSPTKFPAAFDGKWFIGEWNNGWIKTATLDDAGAASSVDCFVACNNQFPGGGYRRPHELEFGPDGSLYVIEWGSGFGGNNADSGIYRIDYIKGSRRPIAVASATPDSGTLPLAVSFSAAGSVDPEGTPLTYEWDFDGNGTVDSTDADPTFTYTTAGTYNARLTVTDATGQTGTDTVPVIAGNSRPEVTLLLPDNGSVANFGDVVPYEIVVTDAEDGSTADGTIDCDDVTLNISLGHDQHAHELAQQQGCEGTFQTETDGGHGAEANIFTVVEATYSDEGGPGGASSVTGRDEAILQPKLKQAEYFTQTGRVEGGRGTDAPGVELESTTDVGGGQSAAFIQDGDYVAFAPYDLQNLDSVTYRVASAGAGGTLELRVDAPDGPLVATSPTITPTGGWQVYTDVTVALDDLPEGERTIYLVARHPTSTGYLFNFNWFRFDGKGAGVSAPPTVSATATPASGVAPLEVAFDSTATDPEGEALTYAWDFGVPGDGDTSSEADPTFTYERAGTYTATLTVTDAAGARTTTTVAVTVTPPESQCPTGELVDDFDGTQLGSAWTVIRPDQLLEVSGGALRIPAQPGDIYGTGGDAKNLVVRDMPAGEWTAVAKLDYEGTSQYHQAGIMVYADDDNFTKFGRLATNADGNGDEKFEFIWEDAGTPRNEAADSTANLPADFPRDYWVRMVSDGTDVTGAYSTDGTTWVPVGRAAPIAAGAKIGLFAFSNAGTGNPVAAFDSFSLSGPGLGGGGAGLSRDDAFDGSALDKERWDAIVADTPAEYSVAGGELTITASLGDIYTGDTNPAPNNFILQDAANAGEDWVIETRISGKTISGGYSQGGLMARVDGDNYVKFDAISDVNQTRINRLELRSEVAGAVQNPQQNVTVTEPQAAGDIWLRMTKAGTSYSGEYSYDGETWTAFPGGPVANAMSAPDLGLFAFSPQAAGQGETVSFDYFLLDGEDPPVECECASPGDEFDGAELDKDRWNAIVREDASQYVLQDGTLRITTVGGDIYTNGDPAGTRNFILQEPPVGDWVIETRVSGTMSGGYEHGGLLVRQDDDNYVKFDLISDDGQTIKNRIELRSEVAGAIQDPQPQVTRAAPGYDAVWLRLTKTGTSYAGEWSEDGETWTSIGQPVTNPMADPDFGIFTLGVNSPGGTVVFDHFAVNGETGCEPGGGEENSAPVLGDVTASPTVGVGPLEVDFTAEATDADGDELTYSWDFQDDGTEDATGQSPTHTYTTPGTKTARVTVSDGEDEATETVSVQVLPADDAEAEFRVLVFSKTAGFRHSSIDEGIVALQGLGEEHGFQVDATEDASVFRAGVLAHYDTVVFLSTTGDVLDDAQQAAFEGYIQGGGGYTGIHAAADTEYDWNWYGHLVGGYFLNHPPGTPTATVHVEDTDHPSTEGLPTPWTRVDEWYNYKAPDFADPTVPDGDYSPRDGGVHVLATVDESTYAEGDGSDGVDDDHPISWCQRYDGGRSWYTGMGHTEASFSEADYLEHLLGGLRVTAGVVEDAACGVEPDTGELDVTAYADPSSGTAPLTVNLTAGVGVPHAGGLTYKWTFPGGDTAFGSSVTTTFTTPGTHTVELTVTDADGNTGTDTVDVTVAAADDLPPTILEAEADVTEGAAPLEVWFHGVAEDPEGGPLTYRWEFGDGGAALGEEAEHTYEESGTFTATLTVTDQAGHIATRSFTITATDPPGNVAPSVEAAAVPASGAAPLQVLFTAQGTDPDGDVLTYRWDFGDGSSASGRRARHTYTANGTYTAEVTATDEAGNTATDTVDVVVGNPGGNQAPTVQVAASRTNGRAPLQVQLTAAGSDPDGDALSYVWSFGDGGAAGGTKVNHVYMTPGTYTATVTVTDAGGETGSASVTITVTAPAQANAAPPPPDAAAPSLAALTSTGAALSVSCEGTGKAKVKLRVSKRLARKLGLESRRIAAKSVQCVAGEQVTVKVKAGKKARRALARKAPKSLRVAVSVALGGLEHKDVAVTFR